MSKQLTFPRVRKAIEQYDTSLLTLFHKSGLDYPPKQLYIRTFKQEKVVEVWASDSSLFKLIKTYRFTATSGKPGPKQHEGDRQIPEGFYHITNFNPESKFHLSIGINYPNQADSIRNCSETDPGRDIYFHGGNETVGCIPIGDENMAELYCLCVQSYALRPLIPVHIFPCKMEEKNLSDINEKFPMHVNFWNSIFPMYRFFQSYKMHGTSVGCDDSGNYTLATPSD